jgi:transposase
MSAIAIIGLDIAKNVFQVHGADADGAPVLKRRIRRGQILAFFASLPPCLVALEACFTSHFWAREIAKHGHEVRMIPPQYVKPFVKRNKTDSADAEAICEAASRPTMRFVAVKSIHQQSVLALHRARDLLVRQRTKLIQALRGYLGEFGLVAPKGAWNVTRLEALLSDADAALVPDLLKEVATMIIAQIRDFDDRIDHLHDRLIAWHRANEVSRRLATIPGIGPVTATLISASVTDAAQFRSGRHFAAWIGLVPREFSTGGRQQLGGISKRGNPQMRRLLIVGAHAVLRWTRRGHGMPSPWLTALLGRRHPNVVAVAIANKLARIAWAIMARGTSYLPQIAQPN